MIEASPYPWPYDGLPAPNRMALVLVAPQAAYAWMDPTGRVRAACLDLQRAAKSAGLLVCGVRACRTAATPARMVSVPAAGTPGWGLLPGFEPEGWDLLVDAPCLDGFFCTGLDSSLWSQKARHLVFAGFGTETAVHSTLRSANDRGYECLVLEDACAGMESGLHAEAMSMIAMSGGIFGAYTSSSLFLKALSTRYESER